MLRIHVVGYFNTSGGWDDSYIASPWCIWASSGNHGSLLRIALVGVIMPGALGIPGPPIQ